MAKRDVYALLVPSVMTCYLTKGSPVPNEAIEPEPRYMIYEVDVIEDRTIEYEDSTSWVFSVYDRGREIEIVHVPVIAMRVRNAND